MKKILMFISLVSLGVNAQDIKGGIKFSTNMPTFSSDIDNKASGKVGYGLGYFETMDLNSDIALQGEINYTHISYETGSGDYKNTFSNNFIEIPVIIKYRMNDFAIGGGFQYCWGLGSENDMGGLLDLSYDINNIKIGARYYIGSEKIYDGNSLNNISLSVGFIIF